MKKTLSLVLALLLCFAFASCGDSNETPPTGNQEITPGHSGNENAGNSENLPKELKKNANGLYELYTAEDLVLYREILENEMRASYEKTGHSYDASSGAILMSDIDMSTVCSEELGSWRPIGYEAVQLKSGIMRSGSLKASLFDGNGHKISGLYISGGNQGALFCELWETEVRNLTIDNSYVSADSGQAAALTILMEDGILRNVCTEKDVQVKMISSGGDVRCYAGAIVAHALEYNDGVIIENCRNYGTVSTDASYCYAGGIVGFAEENVNLIRCENHGQISSTGTKKAIIGGVYLGGIAGEAHGDSYYHGSVIGCINYGTVQSVSNGSVGGIVGNNVSSVKYCVNVGIIHGGEEAIAYGIGSNRGAMYDCLDAGTISGNHAYPIEEKHGICVPANDPALTNGSLVSRLNSLAEGEYWLQGEAFPIWSGLE